jgi:2-polyprenyl-3-methyl-5-hydroxy-6-metoxy-1,4-benzoquinol methylase
MQSIAIVLMCVLAAVAYDIAHDQVTARVCVSAGVALAGPGGRVRRSPEAYARVTPVLAHASGSGGMIVTDELTSVRDGYNRWAAVYDHDGNPLQALEGPIVRAALGDVRGQAVLDLGCGTGRHSLWMADAGATVTAIDFSEGMLAEARRKPGADSVRWLAHDLHQSLPFADATFDQVVSGLVLEHLRELGGIFAEARRVLKPGGRAVVSGMHPGMFLRGAQARFTDPVSGEVVQPGSVPHSVGAFVTAAVQAGFRLDAVAEFAPDESFAARVPRAAKYVGWPMLVVLVLSEPRTERNGAQRSGAE